MAHIRKQCQSPFNFNELQPNQHVNVFLKMCTIVFIRDIYSLCIHIEDKPYPTKHTQKLSAMQSAFVLAHFCLYTNLMTSLKIEHFFLPYGDLEVPCNVIRTLTFF